MAIQYEMIKCIIALDIIYLLITSSGIINQ
jgi:hypothetical protein